MSDATHLNDADIQIIAAMHDVGCDCSYCRERDQRGLNDR